MPAGRTETTSKQNKVLLIAVDQYVHQKPLQNAVRDVEAFRALLIESYGYDPKDFITCYNEEGTFEGMFTALRDLVKESQSGLHNAIIYYSGHGHFDTLLNLGSWVTYDSDNLADNITSGTVVQTFIKLIKAKHIFLIVDACFSGSLFSENSKSATESSGQFFDKIEGLDSRYALTSGRSDQEVPDGPPGGHSPFAALILDYLSFLENPTTSVVSLMQYVKSTIKHNHPQQPLGGPLFNVGHKNGEMIFRNSDFVPIELAVKVNEIDTFTFSLCKTEADFERYLELFPNGQYRRQAEDEMMPMQSSGSGVPPEFEVASPIISPPPKVNAIESIVEKMMNENSPQFDEAIMISAKVNNLENQHAQGILSTEDITIKKADLEYQIKKLGREAFE